MKDYPTLWQRKMMWAALTACFVVILVVIVAAVIWAGGGLIGTALTLFGLNLAAVIGAMVVVPTMIPYIGIIICWGPAVLIAAFQWGDGPIQSSSLQFLL